MLSIRSGRAGDSGSPEDPHSSTGFPGVEHQAQFPYLLAPEPEQLRHGERAVALLVVVEGAGLVVGVVSR